ncbi:MAG: PEP-CTERM sorting domain-containing protein [Phycisphaerales bacterium]
MKTATLLCAVIGGAFACSTASADVLSYLDLTEGVSSQTLDIGGVQVDVHTSPRVMKLKTVNGITGMGIKDGSVTGEIDGNEYMKFEFDTAVTVDCLEIAFLYDNHQFGDHPAEIARVITDISDDTLMVTGPTTAVWSNSGVVVNLSIATEAGGGYWRISGDDIFGGEITSLKLKSGNPGDKGKYADFSFVKMSVVPTPGTAFLLGTGALATSRRRRR